MADTRTEIGAHLDAARRHGWTLVQPVAAHATPSGKTTAEAWAALKGAVLAAAGAGRLDGVLLALHGAMVADGADDAEGDLLAALRELLGPELPIAVTLDLHANVTDAMVRHADITMAYRTYPHIDQYEIATEAADLLQRVMVGEIRPVSTVRRAPLLDGCDHGRTQGGPMSRLLARAQAHVESTHGILAVTVAAGFAWSDIEEAGPSITVVSDGDSAEADRIAEAMIAEVWATRAELTVRPVTVAEAVARADDKAGLLVIADTTDNPGGGGYGDGVRLLEGILAAGLEDAAFACIYDPEAAQICHRAGLGAEVAITLGAKIDPDLYGPPLALTGTVAKLTDGAFVCEGPMWAGVANTLGPTAVLRVGGVSILIASNNLQVTDRQVFLAQGIVPEDCSVIGLKSSHHFRAAFEPIATEVVVVDSGALVSTDYARFPYAKLRRPIWPLDQGVEGPG